MVTATSFIHGSRPVSSASKASALSAASSYGGRGGHQVVSSQPMGAQSSRMSPGTTSRRSQDSIADRERDRMTFHSHQSLESSRGESRIGGIDIHRDREHHAVHYPQPPPPVSGGVRVLPPSTTSRSPSRERRQPHPHPATPPSPPSRNHHNVLKSSPRPLHRVKHILRGHSPPPHLSSSSRSPSSGRRSKSPTTTTTSNTTAVTAIHHPHQQQQQQKKTVVEPSSPSTFQRNLRSSPLLSSSQHQTHSSTGGGSSHRGSQRVRPKSPVAQLLTGSRPKSPSYRQHPAFFSTSSTRR